MDPLKHKYRKGLMLAGTHVRQLQRTALMLEQTVRTRLTRIVILVLAAIGLVAILAFVFMGIMMFWMMSG